MIEALMMGSVPNEWLTYYNTTYGTGVSWVTSGSWTTQWTTQKPTSNFTLRQTSWSTHYTSAPEPLYRMTYWDTGTFTTVYGDSLTSQSTSGAWYTSASYNTQHETSRTTTYE